VQKIHTTCRVLVSEEVDEEEVYVMTVNSINNMQRNGRGKTSSAYYYTRTKGTHKKSHVCSDVELDSNGRFIE
jgi:hypothetical protein